MGENLDMIQESSMGKLAEEQEFQRPPPRRKCFIVNGTIIISNDEGVSNWTPFHWEWMMPWVLHSQNWYELKNYTLYKPKKVTVDFYNPSASYQSDATAATYKGMNPEARLMGFIDDDYLYSPASDTCKNGYEWFDKLFANNSLRTGGYQSTGTMYRLPTVNLDQSVSNILRGQNDFSTKEINCRPGESMKFEWDIDAFHWRRTEEFNFGLTKNPASTYTNNMCIIPRFDYMFMKHIQPGLSKYFPSSATAPAETDKLFIHTFNYSGTANGCEPKVYEYKLKEDLNSYNWVCEPKPIPGLFIKPAEMIGANGSRLIQYVSIPFTLCFHLELGGHYPELLPSQSAKWQPSTATSKNFYTNRVVTVPFAHPTYPYLQNASNIARPILDMSDLAKSIYPTA